MYPNDFTHLLQWAHMVNVQDWLDCAVKTPTTMLILIRVLDFHPSICAPPMALL